MVREPQGTAAAVMRQKERTELVVDRPAAAAPGEDAELVERSRRGENAAFARLVEKYQDRVFNTCWRMCGNRTDAEDFTQEAFVRAFQALDRFSGQAQFYTWVFRIAVNLVISALRRRKRGSVLSLDHASGDPDVRRDGATGCRAGMQIAGGDRPPDEQASRREEQALVRRALEDLEEQQRAIVVLRDLESLDYAEIAEILGVPVGTVKSRLHRARLALAELLGPVLEETRSRTAPE